MLLAQFFCSLSPAFLECSAVGRTLEIWITRISSSTGRVASGEMVSFDLQRVVTQEELVKAGTRLLEPCVKVVFIVVVFALERAKFLPIVLMLLLEICPLQGCPGSGVSRRPGANRCCRDLEVAPLSFWGLPVWAIGARV